MIQTFREKMKSTTVVVVVVLLFVVPMVLTGVGSSFSGGGGSSEVARIGDTVITEQEVRRAIASRKQQMIQQSGASADSEFLKDEVLRPVVVDQLTRRAVVLDALRDGGMGASEAEIGKVIQNVDQFFVDGKFNPQAYRRVLSSVGYTPATFKKAVSEDIVLSQFNSAIANSEFVTPSQIGAIAQISNQQRSFTTVGFSKASLGDQLAVTDDEIQSYYSENLNRFMEQESVVVDYIELSVDQFIALSDVSDEDIRNAYNGEISVFESDTQRVIAHILIDGFDKDLADKKILEVTDKLAAGEEFSVLVNEYSDDKFSKKRGGDLGVWSKDAYGSEFNDAVLSLAVGEVSTAVKTDIGTHFIKLIELKETDIPSFDDRRDDLARQLKLTLAEEQYVTVLEELKELAFGASDLAQPAEQLGLRVKTSEPITRFSAQGIGAEAGVRDVAFSPEVVEEGYNSDVIELSNSRALVLRKNSYSPEQPKALASVKDAIKSSVLQEKTKEKLEAKASEFIAQLKTGGNISELASTEGATLTNFTDAKRMEQGMTPAVARDVFALGFSGEPVYSSVYSAAGSIDVVVLTDVKAGNESSLSNEQKTAYSQQLKTQATQLSISAIEASLVEKSKVN